MKTRITVTLQVLLTIMAVAGLLTAGPGASAAGPASGILFQPGPQQSTGAAPDAPVGAGFTYQGQLKDGANPANGSYDLQFTLFDALAGGNQVGTTQTSPAVAISEGLFTVTLDFGTSAFTGQARWLQIAVRPAGGGSYTTLSPRQPLTATPYAAGLMPGTVITGTLSEPALIITNTSGVGMKGSSSSGTGFGLWGESTSITGYGVFGVNNTNSTGARGVVGQSNVGVGTYGLTQIGIGIIGASTSITAGTGVYGLSAATNGWGIYGVSHSGTNARGVYGESDNGTGVVGYSSTSGTGVYGESDAPNGVGVHGLSGTGTNARGMYGLSADGYGVYGFSNTNSGVYGTSASGVGLQGISGSGDGVFGFAAPGHYGIHGQGGTGVWGETIVSNGVGVRGDTTGGYGVHGVATSGWAGWFDGNVNVTGGCCAAAEGTFKIDHPLDPENKYLVQSAVQSADMMGIYNGNVTTDGKGNAAVTLPDWFEALNKDFRYQLTVIGQFAQAIVAEEIKSNRFTIKTDKPNVKVSWQVTGIRKDPYAQAHPIQVEVEKSQDEQGKYRHPEEWGQPESKAIDYGEINTPGAAAQKSQPNPNTPGR